MFNRWKSEAIRLQAENDRMSKALDIAAEMADGFERRFAERAALVSITRNDRKIMFRFIRNGHLYDIECFGTWDDDVDAWKRDLLEPTKDK